MGAIQCVFYSAHYRAEVRWSMFYVGVTPYANILHPNGALCRTSRFLGVICAMALKPRRGDI